MDRRDFLKTASLGAASLVFSGCTADRKPLVGKKPGSKPNVLWIVVEDMSPHWRPWQEV